jgi:hypothetical protein
MALQKPLLAQIEADHVHNLPNLLASFSTSTDLLRYYRDVSQPVYLEQCRRSGIDYDIGHEEDSAVLWEYLDSQKR